METYEIILFVCAAVFVAMGLYMVFGKEEWFQNGKYWQVKDIEERGFDFRRYRIAFGWGSVYFGCIIIPIVSWYISCLATEELFTSVAVLAAACVIFMIFFVYMIFVWAKKNGR